MKNIFCGVIATACLLLMTGCPTVEPCCTPVESGPVGKTHWVNYGTNKIHYVTAGRGDDTLVLVHCWAGNLTFWNKQIPALEQKARLVYLDLPGHGESDKPQTAYTMDFFAGAVLTVMRDAGVKKATLIGHSMGAPVICRVYTQAPEKVAALVSVDGTLRRPPFGPDQVKQFTAPFSTPNYRAHTTNFLVSMFPNPGSEALRDAVLAEMLATPQYVMAGAMNGMFDAGQPDWDLKKVNVPVIVINAPNPMLWTDQYKEYVRTLSPKSEYRSIEGAGHFVQLEKPAEFNATLIELLQKHDLIAP